MKHIDERTLSAYFDGELNEEKAAAVTQHLEGCARCRDAYEQFAILSETLDTLHTVEPSPYFATQTKRAATEARVPTTISRLLIPATAVAATLASLFIGGYLGQSVYSTVMGNGTNGENGYVDYFDVSPMQDYPEGSFGEVYTEFASEEVNDEG